MYRYQALGLAAAAGFMILSSQPAVIPAGTQIASCRAQGDHAACRAAGTARHHPDVIIVHVRAGPRQVAAISWRTACIKGTRSGTSSRQISSGTPVDRVIRHAFERPDKCTVSARAQLTQAGNPGQWLHVWTSYLTCSPLTNGGHCYQPGEFCRTTDHGRTGIAGDGERIKCVNRNGWRWEPV